MSNTMQFKARIKQLAQINHIPAQAVLQNYMLERFLERISKSRFCDKLILKGGLLISSLVGISNRTTMDIDVTLNHYPLVEEIVNTVITEICETAIDDQTIFSIDHLTPIRDDDKYGGYRVSILARFESIVTPVKIDITTGDIITPGAIQFAFKSQFEDKKYNLFSYTLETVLAEKIETILRRSVLNTRLRDFYDVYILTKTQSKQINFNTYCSALEATAQTRSSGKILGAYSDIIKTIRANTEMHRRWQRYCASHYYAGGIPFDEVLDCVESYNINK